MIRTYFWQPPTNRRLFRKRVFKVGNAGDSFVADLIKWQYGDRPQNVDADGRRLLLVGSVAHRAQAGDVLAGVGLKSARLPQAWPGDVEVSGVRGPRTLAALRASGVALREDVWMGDPGLLIGKVFEELPSVAAVRNRVSFIPHYRERSTVRLPAGVEMIDIDDHPRNVGRKIAESEVIYASSLHGIIWAHALNRPVRAVVPQTEEPEFKYRDYFESIGADFKPAESIGSALAQPAPRLLIDVSAVIDAIGLPDMASLRSAGVAS